MSKTADLGCDSCKDFYCPARIQVLEQALASAQEKITELKTRAEQGDVRLAGCSVAAAGGSLVACQGDYGWSPSYQDVLDLRAKYAAAQAEVARLNEVIAGVMSGDEPDPCPLCGAPLIYRLNPARYEINHAEGCEVPRAEAFLGREKGEKDDGKRNLR